MAVAKVITTAVLVKIIVRRFLPAAIGVMSVLTSEVSSELLIKEMNILRSTCMFREFLMIPGTRRILSMMLKLRPMLNNENTSINNT